MTLPALSLIRSMGRESRATGGRLVFCEHLIKWETSVVIPRSLQREKEPPAYTSLLLLLQNYLVFYYTGF